MWRQKIEENSDKLIKKLDNFKEGSAWTDPISKEELEEVIREYEKPLKEFDEHFKISILRQGGL